MRRLTVGWCVLICVCLVGGSTGLAANGPRTITIFYTGAVEGELEPCGCTPKTDFGGVARRGGYLQGYPMEQGPVLRIDAGNFSGEDTPQGRLKTQTMVRALSSMDYDVAALQTRDRAWVALFSRTTTAIVSGDSSAPGTVDLTRDGIPIHVGTSPAGWSETGLNILLTDKPLADLASLPPRWDLVILSSGETLEEPRRIGPAVVVSGYRRGERLGVLTLQLDDRGHVVHVDHRWQMLGPDVPEEPRVREIMKEYDGQVARLFKEDAERAVVKGDYLGAERCAECHAPFAASWGKTRHASAWAALERVGKSRDPECVRCHTVGFGESGGFRGIEGTPELVNVQCEVCHGPGRAHVTGGYGPMRAVDASTCGRCHTPDHSPDFNYAVYRPRIVHSVEMLESEPGTDTVPTAPLPGGGSGGGEGQ